MRSLVAIALALLLPWLTACQPPPDATADATADAGGTPDADPGCLGVPSAGRCSGEVLETCEQATVVSRDCAAEGLHCVASASSPPACGPVPGGCADLPVHGLCVGECLYICHGDWIQSLPCDDIGGRCALDNGRPGCAPRAEGSRLATGRITLDKRPYTSEGLGDPLTAPAEGVSVMVQRAVDGAPLGFGITDASGDYSIPYDIGAGPDGILIRVAAFNFTATHRTWVTDRDDHTYAFESPTADDSSGAVDIDLHVDEATDAGALNIFGVLYRNTALLSSLTQTLLPPLQALWERSESIACGTCYYAGQLYVLGTPADTDEYDDSVISHEFGHYASQAVSRDDSPGGPHDGTPTDPRQAWSEGLATWLSLVLLGETIYIDTKETGSTVRDPDDMGWDADPSGGMDQDLSEFVVLELLWDIVDPPDATDPVQRPAADVMEVLTGYLPRSTMADRGHPDVELVDFLDGWFCLGKGDPAGITALVVTDQGFPYDFAGPAQPCPKPTEPVRARLRLLPPTGTTLELELTDKLGAARGAVVLYGSAGRVIGRTRHVGPLSAHEPLVERWAIPAHVRQEDIVAGITLARGDRSVDHIVVRLVPPARRASPSPVRRLDLGGLLRLRISALSE
ncbi:MAG: hypothetical protein ABI333_28780 [bacterium]